MRTQAAFIANQVQPLETSPAWTRDEPLRAAGTVIEIGEGQEICTEGDDTDLFYKVVSGVVRVCKLLSDGRRQIEAFHVAGELFGLELGRERLLSAEAVTDCSLIVYRRHTVEQQASHDQVISQQLFQHAMLGLAQAQT